MKIIVATVFLLIAGAAQAQSDLSRPEFYACGADHECVIMADPCGFPAGVNRKYQSTYGRLSFNTPKGECATPDHNLGDFTVRCDDMRCAPQLKPQVQ